MSAKAQGKTCIVLGGSGFVGSAVVAEAQRRGYDVRAVDVNEYAAARGSACDLLVNANGNSRKYLAAQDPSLEFDLSVRSVMQSLQDFRAARYVHLSTVDVYPDCANPANNAEAVDIAIDRLSPYGLHKRMAEQLVQFYAKAWLIFRMAGFVGRGLKKNSIYDLLTGRPLHVHPDSAYQYLNSRDLAAIVFDMVEAGAEREILNVAGDGVITLREVAAMLPASKEAAYSREAPCQHYEINISKIKGRRPIPPTRDTVSAFVRHVLAGTETLS